MTVCEFCEHFEQGACQLGLKLPKKMACGEFLPGIEQFCSEPKDFVNSGQIVEMARFFGFQKMELKKIQLMATREENARTERERILKAAVTITAL